MKKKFLGRMLVCGLLLSLPLLQGCPALILVAFVGSDTDYTTITVEIPRSADAVFASATELSQEGKEAATGEPYSVKKIDKAAYFMRVEADTGDWWFEINLIPVDSGSCQLIMVGQSPGDMEAQKERGLKGVKRLCDNLGVRYKVVENKPEA
jgi:hypothetical protein